jgi:branched-chain amino acid transport system substrate-binding protein
MRRFAFLAILTMCWAAFWVTAVTAQEPIVLGVPTSTTVLEGREALKAVEMAVEELNAKGGIKVGETKRPIRIESIDIRDASPGVPVSEALLGIEKLITQKNVNAIVVGPFRSEALLATMDILAKYKVPMLGTIAMTPKSEEMIKKEPDKYKYVFRLAINAPYLVRYLAQTLGFMQKEFGYNKVFAMYQDVLWAKGTAEGTVKIATSKMGWEDLGAESYPTGASDFAAGLMKAKTKGAQVILPVFDMPQSGILLKQWQSMKIPALMVGFISPMAGPSAWKTFEGRIGGLVNTCFELGGALPSEKYPAAKKFYEAYQKKFGVPMEAGHGPAPAYDSVFILAEAIERAGTLDPDKVVAEIKKTDRPSVIGRVKFDEGNQAIFGNDPAQTAVGAVWQWTEDGKRVIVFPESIAEGKIQLPGWMKPEKK